MLQQDGSYPPAAEAISQICWPKFHYHERVPKQRTPRQGDPPSAEIGNSAVCKVVLEAGGKITLPAALRQHLEVMEGDLLVLDPQPDGTVVVVGLERAVQQARGILRGTAPEVSAVDELIAERRDEARRESEE